MLCGDAAMHEPGEYWTGRHPVMTPDMIRQLPATRALVIRGGHSPVIAKLRMAWNDPIYRRARHLHQDIVTLTPAAEPPPIEPWSPPPITPGDHLPRPGTPDEYPWTRGDDPWDTGYRDEEPGPAA